MPKLIRQVNFDTGVLEFMLSHANHEPKSDAQKLRHEVNNALTGILGHTQLLLLRGQIDDKSRERVEKIEELANRIRAAMIDWKD